MEKPRPLDLEEIEKGLKFEIRDIESELREFKNDEMFFGKNGVDYHYKQELIDRRNEILKTLKLFDGIKQRIKSACDFYLKYKNRSGLLIEDYPEYKKEIDEIWGRYILGDEFIKAYNEWLFKLAFKDVLGDEE